MTNLLWPVPGHRTISGHYADPRDYGLHGGVDFPAPEVPVIAVADGAITYVGWAGNAGRTVWLDFPGYRVQYSHLSSFNVPVGQTVQAGDVIGFVGGSGYGQDNYYGTHLHFCLFASERPVTGPSYWSDFVGMWVLDPELYLGQEIEEDDDMPTFVERDGGGIYLVNSDGHWRTCAKEEWAFWWQVPGVKINKPGDAIIDAAIKASRESA